MMKVVKTITKQIVLYKCALNMKQFLKIIAISRHLVGVAFIGCKINVDHNINFKSKTCPSPLAFKCKTLNLKYCGTEDKCNWGKNPSDFECIIKALTSFFDLKSSLINMHLDKCGMKFKQLNKILYRYGIEKGKPLNPHDSKPK